MASAPDEVARDRRRPPFCYQTHEALDALRAAIPGARRPTAVAVYVALTEAANRSGGAPARNGFRATRKEIAELVGVSPDTLDRYVKDLVEAGLLAVESQKVGAVNLPNLWALTDPPSAPPSRTDAATPSRTDAALKNQEPSTKEGSANALPARVRPDDRPTTVDRRPVVDGEYQAARVVLDRFNELAGTAFSSKDWISKIIMRIREHPELTFNDHARVMQHSLANPWWKGNADPAVVYGNGAQFERSLARAVAPPDQNAPLTPEELQTYGTEWGPGTPYRTLADARNRTITLPGGS